LFVAPNATIVGEVEAGPGSSFWFNSVTRGDVHGIRIGRDTNVQDFSMLHVSYKRACLEIGDEVTIGHHCVLHGCRVGARVLIGMGSILMDHVEVGEDVLIGAGSLLTEGFKVPPRSLVLGRPAKIVRSLNDKEIAFVARSARHYTHVARSYVGGPWPYNGDLHDKE
jgi:carbonic anhydrase/acetyltransferase-like protein (isoleucine patch superfamily)